MNLRHLTLWLVLVSGLAPLGTHAAQKTFADFGTATPAATDYVVGYRPPMGSAAEKRFTFTQLNTYFSANVSGLTNSQISSLAFSKLTGTPTTVSGYGIVDAAPLASPTFTGTPAAPTAAADTNTTQIATTAFVIGQSYLKASTAASTYQPLDSDLTSWAAVTRASGFDTFTATPSGANLASLLTTALPASKGGTGLTSLSANVVSLLGAADYSAMRTQLSLVPGADVQVFDADLSALAALSGTNTIYYRSASDTWTAVTIGSGLSFSGGTLSATGGGLASTDIDTSAELRAIVTDETGTGALVFASDPVLLRPNNPLGSQTINVNKERNTETATGNHTWTFSATPTAGQKFGLVLTGHSAATTQTIPSSRSLARGGAPITTFTLPANAVVELTWIYNGTHYDLAGEPFSVADLSTVAPASADLIAFRDVSAGVDGQNTLATLVAAGLPAFTGDASSSAGASALTLATVNSNVGTFGNATQTASVAVNAKGLVTAASNVTITPAVGSITGLGTNVPAALANTLNASGGLAGYDTFVTLINAQVSDTDYDATSWNGETGVAPSKNAVRDKLEAMSAGTGMADYWEYAISDETTALTTGTAKITFRAPYAATVTAVRASLSTSSSSGNPTFDINEGGTTILSTKLSIDSGEKTSTTAASAAVISDTAIADDAEITIDIDTAGTGATGAKIKIYVTRT